MSRAVKIAIGVVVLAAVFCVGSYALDRHLLGETYARFVPEGPSLMLTDEDVAADYPHEDVSFELDGATLRGCVYGAGNTRGLVIMRHGINSQHQDYLAIATALVDRGWKVFAYDAIGCGESDGDSVLGLPQSPLDVRAAVRFACDSGMADGMKVMLIGHSWGGYGVAGALDFPDVRDRVAACVAMSGFDTPTEIIMDWAESSMGPVAVTQRPFVELIGRLDFGADASRSAARAIRESGMPTMVIHGAEDRVVTYGGTSIMSKLQADPPEGVVLVTKTDAGRNGHNDYFYSPESQSYLDECADRLEADPEFDIGSVDKSRANTADPVLIDEIDGFFANAL